MPIQIQMRQGVDIHAKLRAFRNVFRAARIERCLLYTSGNDVSPGNVPKPLYQLMTSVCFSHRSSAFFVDYR